MKKIIPILLIIPLIVMLIPMKQAYAQEVDILSGKVMNVGTSPSLVSSTTTKVTDSDLTTSESVTTAARWVWYEFEEPINITHYELKNSNQPNLYFYDSGGIQINSTTSPDYSGTKTSFAVNGIKKIAVYNKSSVTNTLYDFKIFTIPPPDFSGGLLDGKAIQRGNSHTSTNGTITNVTDNKVSTFDVIYKSSASNNYVWYEFENLVDIHSYQLSSSGVVAIYGYDQSGLLTYQNTSPIRNGTKTGILNVKNIKKVVLMNRGSTDINLNEFNVFGTVQSSDAEPPNKVTAISYTATDDSITLNWTGSTSPDFHHYEIRMDDLMQTNTLSGNTYTVSGLEAGSTHMFSVVSVDINGNKSEPVLLSATTINPDNVPPANVLNVTYVTTENAVSFAFDLPTDEDFSHLRIYKGNTLIEGNYTSDTFTETGLQPATDYTYRFVSVDKSGNPSSGHIVNFTTKQVIDEEPPPKVEDIVVDEGNGYLEISWKASDSPDLDGYDVYIDGVKHNTALIKQTYYIAKPLQNDREYQVQVVAVDKSGNTSPITDPVIKAPDASKLPLIETEYDLSFVGQGIASWFSSLWLLLVFCIAIPLSFMIGRRIKQLFLV